MMEIQLPVETEASSDKQNFANALASMADQLRLMEQKVTMAADNTIREQFQLNKEEINRATYIVEKLAKKHTQLQNQLQEEVNVTNTAKKLS
ncbi:hypothetical protein FH966_13015 [Lentibacillus cibarius]|uniref:Uncharacterized protein n=1 Tax=Lentibacillus cibarius TaxID=2583219 RepID=A0A549YKY6_9BACI|nr:hypothetical protein [Lentibacillus cibarius]TRM12542.1 hypothetical protein FH966_13015 [Lentibacillus cibarius]